MEKQKIDYSPEELEEIARGDLSRIEEGSAPLQNDDEREAYIIGLLDDMERKQRVSVGYFAQAERRELVERWNKLRFARNARLKREEEAAKQRALDEKCRINFSPEELEEIKRLEQTRGIPFKNDAERERTILQSLLFLDDMEAKPQFYQNEGNRIELSQLKAVREGRAERLKKEAREAEEQKARELEAMRIEADRVEAEAREAREREEQKRKAREREAEAKEEQKRLERKKKKAAVNKSPRTPLKSKTAGKRTPSKPWKPEGKGKAASRRPWTPKPGECIPADKGTNKAFDPLHRADVDKMRYSQAPQLYLLALAVWYDLIREASYRRTLTFEASDSYLAARIPGAGSRNTIRKATQLLESLGMLKSVSGTVTGTKCRESFTRTLYPSGVLRGAPFAPAGHDAAANAPAAVASTAATDAEQDTAYDNAPITGDTAGDTMPL